MIVNFSFGSTRRYDPRRMVELPTPSDFVYVPVPRDRVIEIMRILAFPRRDIDSAPDGAAEPLPEAPHPPAPDRHVAPEPDARPDQPAEPSSKWQDSEMQELVELCPAKQLLVLQR